MKITSAFEDMQKKIEEFDWNNRFDLKTEINGYQVSTVELPLFYETMIFKIEGNVTNFFEEYCVRYDTLEEAKEGHNEAIQYVKEYLIDYYREGEE